MLIRTKQVRNNHPTAGHGTDIELGKGKNKTVLEFRPLNPQRPETDHVCDVEDPEHIAQLLAIPEGFEVHPSELKKKPAPGTAKEAAGNGKK